MIKSSAWNIPWPSLPSWPGDFKIRYLPCSMPTSALRKETARPSLSMSSFIPISRQKFLFFNTRRVIFFVDEFKFFESSFLFVPFLSSKCRFPFSISVFILIQMFFEPFISTLSSIYFLILLVSFDRKHGKIYIKYNKS